MNSFRTIARFGLLFVLLVSFSFTFEACEPGFTIRVHNQSDATLKIFFHDILIGEVASQSEVKFLEPESIREYSVVAKDVGGNVVYTANFTIRDVNGKKTYDVYFPPQQK